MRFSLAVVVLVAGCASAAPADPASVPPTLVAVTATPTDRATPKPTTAPARVLPGEPWIVYEWGVPEADSVGNVIVRPDGTDEHWATPDAPIGGTGEQGGDGWQLHPDWSPDGEQLAFVVDANTPEIEGEKRDIWISEADGSNARQVFDCERPCDTAEFPAWSKDGKSILFVSWEHENKVTDGSILVLLDLDTGEPTTIAETTGPEYFTYPRWSSDGSKVVAHIEKWTDITESSTLEYTYVAVIDISTLPATITPITEPDEWANYPDWHPTEDLIVYSRRSAESLEEERNLLYAMRSDGSEVTLLVDNDLDAVQPTWMPNGSGVTFVLVPGGDFTQATMWAVDADGSNVRAFPNGPLGGSHPRLRPLPE